MRSHVRSFFVVAFFVALISPHALAQIYVVNEGSNTVSVVDPRTAAIVATIPVGIQPGEATRNDQGTRLWVPNRGSNSVSVIDLQTNTVLTTITHASFSQPVAAAYQRGRVVDEDRDEAVDAPAEVWIVNRTGGSGTGSITILDPFTNTVKTTITDASFNLPEGIAVNLGQDNENWGDGIQDPLAYVANSAANNVTRINMATRAVLGTDPVGTTPVEAEQGEGLYVYVANNGSNSLTRIDPRGFFAPVTFPVTGSPRRMVEAGFSNFTFDDNLFVALQNATVARVQNPTTVTYITFAGASNIWAVDLDEDNNIGYAIDATLGRLHAFNITAGTEVTTGFPISGFSTPKSIVVKPLGLVGSPFVVHNDSGQTMYVRISPEDGGQKPVLVVRDPSGSEYPVATVHESLTASLTNIPLGGFTPFSDMNNSGVVAFKAGIDEPFPAVAPFPCDSVTGIFTSPKTGPSTLVARTFGTVTDPTGTRTFYDFDPQIDINDAGQVGFTAAIDPACNEDIMGAYRYTPGIGVQTMLAHGMTLDGGITVTEIETSIVLNELGHMLIKTNINDPGTASTVDQAILIVRDPPTSATPIADGDIVMVARNMGAAPGGTYDRVIETLGEGSPSRIDLNDSDQVLFKGEICATISASCDGDPLTQDQGRVAVLLFTPGTGTQILAAGRTGPTASRGGTGPAGQDVGLATGGTATGETFEGFGKYFDLNNLGQAVFKAGLEPIPAGCFQDDCEPAGIYFWNGTALVEAVHTGDVSNDGSVLTQFSPSLSITDSGHVHFLEFSDATFDLDGIYVWTSFSGIQTVVRKGQTYLGGTITGFSENEGYSFDREINENGELATNVVLGTNRGNSEDETWGQLFIGAALAPPAQADLTITKTDSPDPVVINGTLTYTLTVTNNGPDPASTVVVTDNLPAGVTFVSATATGGGSCTHLSGTVTCSIPTIGFPGSETVTINVTVPGSATSLTNSASVSAATLDPGANNNASSSSTTVIAVTCPTIGTMTPANGASDVPLTGHLTWTVTGGTADFFNVYFGPAGSGCSMGGGTTTATSEPYGPLAPLTAYEWRVVANKAGCPPMSSPCASFTTAPPPCNTTAPTPRSPVSGVVTTEQVTFSWAPATGFGLREYDVYISVNGGAPMLIGSTSLTSLTATVPRGVIEWYVVAEFFTCPALQSSRARFESSTCAAPGVPIPLLSGEITTDEPYTFGWREMACCNTFEYQEARTPNFSGAPIARVQGNSVELRHSTDNGRPAAYYYRVRAISNCDGTAGPFSKIVRIVVVPLPPAVQKNPRLVAQFGKLDLLITRIFIPHPPGKTALDHTSVHVSTDRTWLSVNPSTVTPSNNGTTVTVTANPAGLPVGTNTGTVIVTNNNNQTVGTTPVSVTLVTPVAPVGKNAPPNNTLIVPAVAHVEGVNSLWQSDIRIFNSSLRPIKYALTFTPSGEDGTQEGKRSEIEILPGNTTAVDDIVKQWYGLGSLSDQEGVNGVLEIRPLDFAGKMTPEAFEFATVASSRTYNITPAGTLGQYIPAIPFPKFIGKPTDPLKRGVLSMQQISQSAAYRTNVGIVEASGAPARVKLSVFNSAGVKIHEFLPIDLKPAEHKQLGAILFLEKIALDDGRIEAEVLSDTGRVMAYASVIDNRTNDPLLVDGVNLASLGSSKYVLPGVADISNSLANWQTDVRLFNASTAPVTATLTFYPQDNPAEAKTAQVTIAANEIKVLDNLLESTFGVTNTGGALHVTTPASVPLVATARTFNAADGGTYGQFIPAVTPAEALGLSDRSGHILQIEESERFRTNIGLAEVNGAPITVEITALVPDSTVAPRRTIQLRSNEFKQINSILKELGLPRTYNGRVTIKVISGSGKLAAYGSIVDNTTQDPTFVPIQ